jgi:anti-sigma B factor antagonist
MKAFGLTLERAASGAVVISLRGEFDFEHAYFFDEELRAVEAGEPSAIVIDLRRLDFIDSCGIGRLLSARRRAARAGCRFLLVRGGRSIERVFALSGLTDSFETVDDVPAELGPRERARASAGD